MPKHLTTLLHHSESIENKEMQCSKIKFYSYYRLLQKLKYDQCSKCSKMVFDLTTDVIR
jgi:hypothetical protein